MSEDFIGTNIPEYDTIPQLAASNLAELALGIQDRNVLINSLKAEVEELKGQIMPLMIAAGTERVSIGNLRVTKVKGRKASVKLSEEKLLLNGVPIAKIQASYVTGKEGAPSIRVSSIEDPEETE